MSYSSEVLADSPIGYWKLDSSAAYNEITASNSTLIGTPTVAAARVGSGWTFNQTQAINLGGLYNDFTSDNTWTIETWLKRANTSTPPDATFWRRDGNGKAVLFRVVNSADATNGGKVYVYLNGTSIYSTVRVDDNAWHHVVVTSTGTGANGVTIYIDGVARGTGTNPGSLTLSSGSGTQTIGHAGPSLPSGEGWAGGLDEFAIYGTALSSGRVTAHFDAAGGVTVAAAPATATATAVDPTKVGNPNRHVASEDSYVSSASTGTNYGSANVLAVTASGATTFAFIKFPTPPNTGTVASAMLRLYVDPTTPSQTARTFDVKAVSASWAEGTLTFTNRPATTGSTVTSGTLTPTASTWIEIDITSIVGQWVAGTLTNNGITVEAAGSTVYFQSKEGGLAPEIVVAYVAPDTTVNASPATGSALAVDPALSTGRTITATALTASADLVNPTFTSDRSVNDLASPATASAAMVSPVLPNAVILAQAATASVTAPGGGFAVPVVMTAPALTATAAAVDPAITHENNVFFTATTAFALAALIPPAEAQSALDDVYAQRLASQGAANTGNFWFLLNETSGTVANNFADGLDGTYVGSPTFGAFGPEARRVVGFDGIDDYINLPDNEGLVHGGVFEFVFRTEQANTVLVQGVDYIINQFFGQPRGTLIGLENGRINVMPSSKGDFVGRTVLNDNKFHHIIVNFDWNQTGFGDYPGTLTVYVDGVLEMRRLLLQEQTFLAIPDTIGKGGGGFKGEFMNFVFQQGVTRNGTDAPRNYYAVWGIEPKYATPATAGAEMENARGKGNQKRALGLYYNGNRTNEGITSSGLNYAWTGLWQNAFSDYTNQPYDFAGYKVFPQSITGVKTPDTTMYLEGQFYDRITGELRYIDLMEDIDVSEYDLVFFLDLPPLDNPAYNNSRLLFENMVGSLREAIDEYGLSLWCPQPQLAIQLGIIGQVEAQSFLRESRVSSIQGNAVGLYDYRSAFIDEWAKKHPGNLTLAERAYFYWDMHAANKYRITAQIDGLTDLQGWIEEDFYFIQPRDPFNPSRYSFKYKELTSGLQIGDEVFPNQDFYRILNNSSSPFYGGPKKNFVSVPPGQVRAGVILTKENVTHYVAEQEVANPYADYATSIVVSPGDNLNGRPVGGKIFVNFMEDAGDLGITSLVYQVVPPNEQIPDPNDYEDAAQRDWDYSGYRWSVGSTTVSGGRTVTAVTDATGTAGTVFQYQDSPNLVSVNINEKYPVDEHRRYGLLERAFNWLADRTANEPGAKTVRPAPLEATASMPQPMVSAQRDHTIPVEPALANAAMARPLQDNQGGVTVVALPATASAYMTGKAVNIAAQAMTATAELAENFELVFAGGRQVFVYLPAQEATMYLKEDA